LTAILALLDARGKGYGHCQILRTLLWRRQISFHGVVPTPSLQIAPASNFYFLLPLLDLRPFLSSLVAITLPRKTSHIHSPLSPPLTSASSATPRSSPFLSSLVANTLPCKPSHIHSPLSPPLTSASSATPRSSPFLSSLVANTLPRKSSHIHSL